MPPKKKTITKKPQAISATAQQDQTQKKAILNEKVKSAKLTSASSSNSKINRYQTSDLSNIFDIIAEEPKSQATSFEEPSKPESQPGLKKKVSINTEDKLAYSHKDLVTESSNIKIETKYSFLNPPLGYGGFGVVYKCIHKTSNNIRAVKKIPKKLIAQKDPDKMRNEIEILKTLDHPNIIKTYEFFEDELYFYIVTDICEGGELFDQIAKQMTFNEHTAASIIKQVLSAITYCHRKNLVHRDLKPENIIFDKSPESCNNVKVIDFGNSVMFEPNSRLNVKFGSVYYIAPEVLRSDYNEKCDIWSLGVILYILLSGNPPFSKPPPDILNQMMMTQG